MALTGRKAMSALMPAIGGKANDICSCRAFQLLTPDRTSRIPEAADFIPVFWLWSAS
jgi:hypothetical protein